MTALEKIHKAYSENEPSNAKLIHQRINEDERDYAKRGYKWNFKQIRKCRKQD